MGIAVAVGAGIFSVGAQAAAQFAGPSVIVSFVIAAITCALAVMCYAEFASTIPVAGSAYTFTYASLGEVLAWVVGWNLILETLAGASLIAKYWGVYLDTVLTLFHLHVPATVKIGLPFTWGPVVIVAVFTVLLVVGTQLTSRVGTVVTVIKLSIVAFIIIAGALFIRPSNWMPFIPTAVPTHGADGDAARSVFSMLTGAEPSHYGALGMLAAASLVFFAFLGFDVVASSAEEVRNPARNLPRGIFLGLGVVTVLYVLVSVVLTGMVPYTTLAADPAPTLATAFQAVGVPWAAGIISVGSLIGLTTVVMVLLLGLARTLFAISRDGLLPRVLSVTSRRGTPARAQVLGGVVVAAVAGFVDISTLEGMINAGTLAAFILVSIGVPVLRRRRPNLPRPFRIPFGPVLPILSAVLCGWLLLNLTAMTWLYFTIWIGIGITIYLSYGRRHSRLAPRQRTDTF